MITRKNVRGLNVVMDTGLGGWVGECCRCGGKWLDGKCIMCEEVRGREGKIGRRNVIMIL